MLKRICPLNVRSFLMNEQHCHFLLNILQKNKKVWKGWLLLWKWNRWQKGFPERSTGKLFIMKRLSKKFFLDAPCFFQKIGHKGRNFCLYVRTSQFWLSNENFQKNHNTFINNWFQKTKTICFFEPIRLFKVVVTLSKGENQH